MGPTVYVYDRWGAQTGVLAGLLSLVRVAEVNGEDALKVTSMTSLAKGQRLVLADGRGVWHEYVVSETEEERSGGAVACTAYCEGFLRELTGDYIVDRRPSGSAAVCLASLLDGLRIRPGTVTAAGTAQMSWYHVSAREALSELVAALGCEMRGRVTVAGDKVTGRHVDLVDRVGAASARRFEYGSDLTSVRRSVDGSDVVTALYGYGKGIPLHDEGGDATGGYSRKITFGDINGGRDYLEDDAAKRTWGLPGPDGTTVHVFGKVEFDDCEDPAELKRLTREALDRMSQPAVTYEADVLQLARGGLDADGISEGDTVALVDTCFDPPLRLSGRVLRIEEDLLDATSTRLTLGNVAPALDPWLAAQASSSKALRDHAASWDSATQVDTAYLDAVVDRLNEQFKAGGSYKFESFELGTIYSSVPLDKDGRPTRTPAMAMQLTGAGFRIANRTKSDGAFDWRTFGTGAGFTADELTVGTITGGANSWNLNTGDLLFRRGSIADTLGRSVWDLTKGSFTTKYLEAASAKITSSTIADCTATNLKVESGDISSLRAGRVGANDYLYMRTGLTVGGNQGASFVNPYGNYLDIEALKATDDTTGATTGTGLATFDEPFMSASTHYDHLWLFPPSGIKNTYLRRANEQLFLKAGGDVYLQKSATRGIFMGSDRVMIKFDNTHYVLINSSGIQCRCGSKGFGWYNGSFTESLTWKE